MVELHTTADLADHLHAIAERLKDRGSPLLDRIRTGREELTRAFPLVRYLALTSPEYALQMLVRADSRLDVAEETQDELRVQWACLDVEEAAEWLAR